MSYYLHANSMYVSTAAEIKSISVSSMNMSIHEYINFFNILPLVCIATAMYLKITESSENKQCRASVVS